MQLPTPPSSPRLSPSCAPEDRLGHPLAGRYQLNTVLGVGAYGVVYTAVDVQTGVTYAVKALNKIGLDARQRQFQQREIELHQRASQHPNICAVIEILDSEDVTFVVLEYCGEGDLFANITERGNYVGNDFMARRIFSQILDAVEYCHSLGIYHRDLKPENILVCDNGMNVKLADFGLATTDFYSTDFGCGSTFYMSPECQQPVPKPFSCYASAPNDVWSLGVVLVHLTCGRNPWKRASLDDSTFRAFLRDPQFLRTILPISAELDCILRRIFEFDAARRITIPELRQLIARCQSFSIKPVTSHAVEQQTTLYTPQSTAETTPRTSMDQYIQAKPQHAEYNNGNSPQHSHRHRYAHRRGNAVKQNQQQHYVSPQTSGWYMNFLPALDLAQKHMSIEPLLGGVRVF